MDEIISVQVVNMIRQQQIQLLRLQQHNQNAAVMALMCKGDLGRGGEDSTGLDLTLKEGRSLEIAKI